MNISDRRLRKVLESDESDLEVLPGLTVRDIVLHDLDRGRIARHAVAERNEAQWLLVLAERLLHDEPRPGEWNTFTSTAAFHIRAHHERTQETP